MHLRFMAGPRGEGMPHVLDALSRVEPTLVAHVWGHEKVLVNTEPGGIRDQLHRVKSASAERRTATRRDEYAIDGMELHAVNCQGCEGLCEESRDLACAVSFQRNQRRVNRWRIGHSGRGAQVERWPTGRMDEWAKCLPA